MLLSRNKKVRHFAVFQGREPAGLGNEVFNFSKVQIAKRVLDGFVISPRYRSGLHTFPMEFLDNPRYFYKARLWLSKLSGNLFIINEDIYWHYAAKTGRTDYEEVFKAIVEENSQYTDYLHASRMAGGYLAILSQRQNLRDKFTSPSLRNLEEKKIVIHFRGGLLRKSKALLSRHKSDFQPPIDNLTYGKFNIELPISYYVKAIACISESRDFRDSKIVIISNLDPADDRVIELRKGVVKYFDKVEFKDSGPLEAISEMICADLIIPSISSFSLLGLFLSESKYLWPYSHLFESQGHLSIWGYEKSQVKGTSQRNTEIMQQATNFDLGEIRGFPFPPENPLTLKKWLSLSKCHYNKVLDLIYYGVVPREIADKSFLA